MLYVSDCFVAALTARSTDINAVLSYGTGSILVTEHFTVISSLG